MESTPSSLCSSSDSPFSRQGAALAHLDSVPPHDLVRWTDGYVSFPLGKDELGTLANCSLYGTEAPLSFSAAPYAQVFPLKPTPFCKLFAGLGSTNKSATSLLLLSDSRHSVFPSIFPLTSNYLADLAGTVFSLLFYQATIGTRTLVSPGEQRG